MKWAAIAALVIAALIAGVASQPPEVGAWALDLAAGTTDTTVVLPYPIYVCTIAPETQDIVFYFNSSLYTSAFDTMTVHAGDIVTRYPGLTGRLVRSFTIDRTSSTAVYVVGD